MLIGIFTARSSSERREAVRMTWNIPAGVSAKFVICGPNADGHFEDTRASVAEALVKEIETYNDMMYVTCREGYGHGLLTKKLLSFLKGFHEKYSETPLVYKVDDDTIANLPALMKQVQAPAGQYIIGGLWGSGDRPVREWTSPWYEPVHVFAEWVYPPTPLGGPGYVLSWPLIDYFLQSDIAPRNILWNEDRAVAVWVDKALKAGLNVSKVVVDGSEGYGNAKCELTQGTNRSTYNVTLLHHVSSQQMLCFKVAWRADEPLHQCFC